MVEEAAGEKTKKPGVYNFSKFAIREFDAEVQVLHHATTIKEGYQAVVHAGVVRQAVKILDLLESELLRNGDKGIIRCRFMYRPEFLQLGNQVMFREGRTKMLGIIKNMVQNDDSVPIDYSNPVKKKRVAE